MSQYPGMTPPTEPAEGVFDEPKTWPKVVGIISIAWAGLGLVCGTCGLFSPVLMKNFMPPEMTQGPMPPSMTPGIEMYVLTAVSMALSGFLLASGIMLVGRKRPARAMHLFWAVVACLMTVVMLFIQWRVLEQNKVWIQQNPDSFWAKQGGQNRVGELIGLAVGAVMGFAWPLFCLFWFGLVKRDPAEIDAGVEETVV